MSLEKYLLIVLLCGGLINNAHSQALRSIPEESGFGGHINIGIGTARVESNMLAGLDVFGGLEFGDDTIDSLFSRPDSETETFPLPNFEVNYTFAPQRTQIYIGNLLEDFIRLDATNQLGVRYEFKNKSIFTAGYLFTPIATEVWADPYVVNRPRVETDRDTTGIRFTVAKIGGTGLELQYTKRNIDIDDEFSGLTQLGLAPVQAALLDREGDLESLKVTYSLKLGERNRLAPAITYTDFDLDGDAMANDRIALQLTHLYIGERFNFITNAHFSDADYDAVNPIYGKKRDDDIYGIGFIVVDKKIFGDSKWQGTIMINYHESDSNINFYDTKATLIGVTAFRRF